MKPFPTLFLVTALLISASAASAATVPGQATPPPNIVVLLADDEGWGDLSLTGNTNLRTPNIDSIGRAGAVFDRFFVCSVCAPTRAEFLTGRYHSRGGVRGVSTGLERLNLDEKTIADAFKAAGYATGAFGKWHNGSQWPYHPNARGFDEYYGFTSGHWAEYFNPPLEHNGKPVRGHGFITDDLTDHALAFIAQNKSRPFFCYIPYNTPHSPFCVPDEYWNRFKDSPVSLRGQDGASETVSITRCVLAMTENLDWNVGRVLRQLDELKLSDNTIVIYFSDNGPNSWRWDGGMKGRKGSTDEGGLRVPFFIRWPGRIAAGRTVPQIAGAIDLLPTLTHLTGVTRIGNRPLDGKDLSPLLLGQTESWPDRMIFSHQNGQVSVRTQRHRLDSSGVLFDLVTDPGQKTDISAEQPAVTASLQQAVATWRQDVFGAAAANADAPATKGKVKKKAGKIKAPEDDRPYPVGYAEFPWTPLPARDGVPHGGVKRSSGAPNSSYFTQWSKTDDTITWDIDVHQTGNYKVEIYYTCPPADAGSQVELSFNQARITGKVTPGWDPPLQNKEDRVPRVAESYWKDFHSLTLGTVRLEKGRGPLTLRALEIPGRQVMDMRLVALTLEQP